MKAIVITGDKEIDRKLAPLTKPAEINKVCRRGLRAGCKMEQAAIRMTAPRGETGFLAKGPKIKAFKRSRKGPGYQVVYMKPPEGKWYAGFVEFGAEGIRPFPGQHFMRIAFENTRAMVRATMLNHIRRDLDGEFRR